MAERQRRLSSTFLPTPRSTTVSPRRSVTSQATGRRQPRGCLGHRDGCAHHQRAVQTERRRQSAA